jgi:hypothetical protein
MRTVVAKQLAKILLVVGDAMLLDQSDEIMWRVAGQRGAAEVRVAGKEVVRTAMQISEVAAPAAGATVGR